jgi:hypothetical protein
MPTRVCNMCRRVQLLRSLPMRTALQLGALMLVILGAAVASLIGALPANASASSAPRELYFGVMYPGTPDVAALRTEETKIGKGVSLALWYQGWELYDAPEPFPIAQMEAIRQHGSIPVLAWEPHMYAGNVASSRYLFSLTNIISGAWDNYLTQFAKDTKAWGHPFFLRFASEMNGSWVQWSETANGNHPGQFVQAWRHVHDIFSKVGATNVTWVWCPNVENAQTTPLEELYPGDAYVDWLGIDGYNYSKDLDNGSWASFAQVFQPTYRHLVGMTTSSKPIMIGETGAVEHGGSKPTWITDALVVQLPTNFPRVQAVIWFDSTIGSIDVSIASSPQSLAAFRSAVASNTYKANVYGALNSSPIPIPDQVSVSDTSSSNRPGAVTLDGVTKRHAEDKSPLAQLALQASRLRGTPPLLAASILIALALPVILRREMRDRRQRRSIHQAARNERPKPYRIPLRLSASDDVHLSSGYRASAADADREEQESGPTRMPW